MKIENFEKAKEIKEKIDALQEQLEQVKIAINQNKKPSGETFEVVNFKFTYIKWNIQRWISKIIFIEIIKIRFKDYLSKSPSRQAKSILILNYIDNEYNKLHKNYWK